MSIYIYICSYLVCCLKNFFWPASPRQRVSSIWLVFWYRGFWLRSAPKRQTTRTRGFFLHTYHHLSLLPPTCHYLYLPLPAAACHYLPLSHYLQLPVTTCYILPLPLPTTTCHCLQLPANVYRYLFLSDHQLLPLWPSPANIYLSPDPFAQIASAEIIQQTRMPNNLNRLLLEDPHRQRISSIWFVFWNPCF